MNSLDKILKDIIEDYLDDDSIIESYQREYGISPEDLLIEKESRKEAVELIRFAMEYLTETEKKVLFKYIFENKNQFKIADEIGVHRSTISRMMSNIPEHIRKLYNKHALNVYESTINMRGFFSKVDVFLNPTFEQLRDLLFYKSPFHMHKITSMGWPFDIARSKFISAGWMKHRRGKRAGIVEWRAKYGCGVSNYLKNAFQGMEPPVCPFCKTCRKKGSD